MAVSVYVKLLTLHALLTACLAYDNYASPLLLIECPKVSNITVVVPADAKVGRSLVECVKDNCRLYSSYEEYRRNRDRVLRRRLPGLNGQLAQFFYSQPDEIFELSNGRRAILSSSRPASAVGGFFVGRRPIVCREEGAAAKKFWLNVLIENNKNNKNNNNNNSASPIWLRSIFRYNLIADTPAELIINTSLLLVGNSRSLGNRISINIVDSLRSRSRRRRRRRRRLATARLTDGGRRLLLRYGGGVVSGVATFNLAALDRHTGRVEYSTLRLTIGASSSSSSSSSLWSPTIVAAVAAGVSAFACVLLVLCSCLLCRQRFDSTVAYKRMSSVESGKSVPPAQFV